MSRVSRSGGETIIHITPADEYSDRNLQMIKGFNLAGIGCIAIIALIVGFAVTMQVVYILAQTDLVANDVLAVIIMAAIFFPVTYLAFVRIRRWDQRRSGPTYPRQPETVIIGQRDIRFGEYTIPVEDILSVDARHPPEYGGGADTVVYESNLQGRARASGYASGIKYIARCYAIYVRSAKLPYPVIAAFGLTMPSASEIAEIISSEVRGRRN